jgi:hypothetical protein
MKEYAVFVDLDLTHEPKRNNILAYQRFLDLLEAIQDLFPGNFVECGHKVMS